MIISIYFNVKITFKIERALHIGRLFHHENKLLYFSP